MSNNIGLLCRLSFNPFQCDRLEMSLANSIICIGNNVDETVRVRLIITTYWIMTWLWWWPLEKNMCAWNSKIVKWRKCKHAYHHRTCIAHMHYVCVNKHTENMCMKNKSCISCISSIYKVFMSTNAPWWGKNTILWMVNWCDDGTVQEAIKSPL